MEKFRKELANQKNKAIKKIGEYLLSREDIHHNLTKENKSLKQCYDYIVSCARKKAVNNCACLADEDVFALAVHYYDEDNLDTSKLPKTTSAKVVTSEEMQEDVSKIADLKEKEEQLDAARKEIKEQQQMIRSKMNELGISVVDDNGKQRNTSDVIKDFEKIIKKKEKEAVEQYKQAQKEKSEKKKEEKKSKKKEVFDGQMSLF